MIDKSRIWEYNYRCMSEEGEEAPEQDDPRALYEATEKRRDEFFRQMAAGEVDPRDPQVIKEQERLAHTSRLLAEALGLGKTQPVGNESPESAQAPQSPSTDAEASES